MKKLIWLSLIVGGLLLSSSSQAMVVDKMKLDTFMSNLERSLKSDNDGVRYWSLFLLARLKSDIPEMKLDRFNKMLTQMVDKDKAELVRVHAKLTYLFINDADLVQKIKIDNKENPIPFYVDLHMELHNQKFGLEDVNKNDQYLELFNELADIEKTM